MLCVSLGLNAVTNTLLESASVEHSFATLRLSDGSRDDASHRPRVQRIAIATCSFEKKEKPGASDIRAMLSKQFRVPSGPSYRQLVASGSPACGCRFNTNV